MGQPHILFRIFPYVGLTLLSGGAYYLIHNDIFFDFFFAVFGLQSAVFILNALWWSGLPVWILVIGELLGLTIVFHLLGPWAAAFMVTFAFWLCNVGGQKKTDEVTVSATRTTGNHTRDNSKLQVQNPEVGAGVNSKENNGNMHLHDTRTAPEAKP
jgi:hypothetical protein